MTIYSWSESIVWTVYRTNPYAHKGKWNSRVSFVFGTCFYQSLKSTSWIQYHLLSVLVTGFVAIGIPNNVMLIINIHMAADPVYYSADGDICFQTSM